MRRRPGTRVFPDAVRAPGPSAALSTVMFGLGLVLLALPAASQTLPTGNPALPEVVRFYHTDALGSVRAVSDRQGDIVARYDYLPYGERIPPDKGRDDIAGYGSDAGNKHRFTAKERDSESNLDYFGARYFSGAQGRFSSADPEGAGSHLANSQSWNGYAYALNNPFKYVDPDGESATLIGGVAGGLGGGAVALFRGKAWNEVGAAILAGAAGGALAGSVIDTFGASAAVIVGASALGGAAAGTTERTLLGQGTTVGQVALDTAAGAAGGVLGVGAGKAVGAAVNALTPATNLGARAAAIHGALDPIAQRMRTTAAAEVVDAAGNRSIMVGSSRPTVSPAQRAVMRPGEVAARGPGHAERTIINAAKQAGQQVKKIAPSRPPCKECEELLRRENVIVER